MGARLLRAVATQGFGHAGFWSGGLGAGVLRARQGFGLVGQQAGQGAGRRAHLLQLVAEEARVAEVVREACLPVQIVPQQQHRRVLGLLVPLGVGAPALDRHGDTAELRRAPHDRHERDARVDRSGVLLPHAAVTLRVHAQKRVDGCGNPRGALQGRRDNRVLDALRALDAGGERGTEHVAAQYERIGH